VSFELQDPKSYSPGRQLGFIAQAVKQAVPELVKGGGKGYYSISQQGIIPLLVEAFKSLWAKVSNLEALVLDLLKIRESVRSIWAEIAELKTQMKIPGQTKPSGASAAAGLHQYPAPGPQDTVIYRGESRLERGSATIQLPGDFEASTLKEHRTVQITYIDGYDRLAVKTQEGRQIKDGKIIVASEISSSTQRFNWEVKAIPAPVPPVPSGHKKEIVHPVQRFR
jgi:hypothetical protein